VNTFGEGGGMRGWWREASSSAAFSFGVRHAGFFAGLHATGALLRGLWWIATRLLPSAAILAGVVALVWWLWTLGTPHVSGAALLLAAVILGAVVLVVGLASPIRRRLRSWRCRHYF
jgi:hypothetical protein